jgi:hypothetical protein
VSIPACFVYVIKLLTGEDEHFNPLNEGQKKQGYLGLVFFVIFICVVGWAKNNP